MICYWWKGSNVPKLGSLASYWSHVTDSVVYTIYGLKCLRQGDKHRCIWSYGLWHRYLGILKSWARQWLRYRHVSDYAVVWRRRRRHSAADLDATGSCWHRCRCRCNLRAGSRSFSISPETYQSRRERAHAPIGGAPRRPPNACRAVGRAVGRWVLGCGRSAGVTHHRPCVLMSAAPPSSPVGKADADITLPLPPSAPSPRLLLLLLLCLELTTTVAGRRTPRCLPQQRVRNPIPANWRRRE